MSQAWQCHKCQKHREHCICSTNPRVRFCWSCGRKLRGNHFKEIEVDGHPRILHKTCAENEVDK